MTNLRNEARDRECMVRSPACNFDISTTVLAHVRMAGISGMGMKSPDILGAWCCARCHTLVDTGRCDDVEMMRDERDLLLLQGMARTLNQLWKEGKIKC
jgi:Protein of unknown function (DUF1364)